MHQQYQQQREPTKEEQAAMEAQMKEVNEQLKKAVRKVAGQAVRAAGAAVVNAAGRAVGNAARGIWDTVTGAGKKK